MSTIKYHNTEPSTLISRLHHSTRLTLCICVTAGLLAVAVMPAAAIASTDAKIEKQTMGKASTDKPMQVSPAGQHVAWVAMEGSRTTVMVDGVPGPKVDQILSPNEQVIFSDDGAH